MSVLDFGSTKNTSNSGWNYSKPDQAGYSPDLEGDVVKLFTPQAINFATKQPEFWPNGEPKLNVGMIIQDVNGNQFSWTFKPSKNGKAAQAVDEALHTAGLENGVRDLLGKRVHINTPAGNFNASNPRPWTFVILGQGTSPVIGIDESVPEPQQPQPQQQPMQQQYQQQPQQQYVQQAPAQQQYQQQPSRLNQVMAQAGQAMGFAPQQQAPQPMPQAPAYDPNDQVPY